MIPIFYQPENAWAADCIPFFHNGTYYLYYLLDWRDKEGHGEGTPWYLVTTRDMVHFTEYGEMLARGTADAQDLYVFTGSVVQGLGQFHIFYTGHNHHLSALGKPAQGIMHAVSDDLLHWRKLPEQTFFAPLGLYEKDDWRDPYVFWNEAAGEFWMLVCARTTHGPARRRGCTALCTSTDLQHWQVRPKPFYAPGLYHTHECPDLFRMGDWWYLLFSEFTERTVTRYRMARSLDGPWTAPVDDTFDGRAFYAAKTAADSEKRYLFGWNPTREGAQDNGALQWGGSLVCHELWQRPDGTLAVKPPQPQLGAFDTPVHSTFQPGVGACRISSGSVELSAIESFACSAAGMLPARCCLRAVITFEPGTRGCGLVLRASEDLDSAYYLRLEPYWQRIVFDSWPRPGDQPHMQGLERPLALHPGEPVELTVLIENDIIEAYIAGQAALSARMYDLPAGSWGFFVQQGSARIERFSLHICPGDRS